MPTPAGLTRVGVDRFENGGVLHATKEVNINYRNTTMSCDQLRTAWQAVLRRAGRAFVAPPDSAAIRIIDVHGAKVTADLGGVALCDAPAVAVEQN